MSAPSTEPPPDAPKRQRPTLAQRLLLSSDAMLGDLPDPQERLQLERQLVHRLLRAKREVLVSSAVVGPLLVLWLTLPELGWARTVIPLALLLALSGELRRAFIEKYGTTNCQQLLEQFVGQVEGQKCKKLTADTAGMLFDLVQRTNQSQS